MAEGLSASARQAHAQPDTTNKYARVIKEALAEKQQRRDLDSPSRTMQRAAPPNWPPPPDDER